LQTWQACKSGEKAKKETRVSTSDPQARAMHQPDGGLALSYNAQISTGIGRGQVVIFANGAPTQQQYDLLFVRNASRAGVSHVSLGYSNLK
jgi:hypothetical protein